MTIGVTQDIFYLAFKQVAMPALFSTNLIDFLRGKGTTCLQKPYN